MQSSPDSSTGDTTATTKWSRREVAPREPPDRLRLLAGVRIPEEVQGRSLRPPLEQREDPDWDEPLYYHYYEYPRPHRVRRHYGIRTDRYKLIYYYGIGEWELFDLHRDPNELRNVVKAPLYAGVLRDLKKELRARRDQYGDQTGKAVPKP